MIVFFSLQSSIYRTFTVTCDDTNAPAVQNKYPILTSLIFSHDIIIIAIRKPVSSVILPSWPMGIADICAQYLYITCMNTSGYLPYVCIVCVILTHLKC